MVVLSAAEWALGRAVQTVLDVGSGEGHWRAPLRALRRGLVYTGVDPSDYVVRRFGRRRNIHKGSFSDTSAVSRSRLFDLVVCAGVVQFLTPDEFIAGIPGLARHTGGLLHLEIFSAEDDIVGDLRGDRQPAAWYRKRLAEAGLIPCGMHNYVTGRTAGNLCELELLPR
jgi:SAM-dependent methyltransferase